MQFNKLTLTDILVYFSIWLMLTVLAVLTLGDELERYLFPVTSDTKIETTEVIGLGGTQWTAITGSADKLRDCVFMDLHWYLADPLSGRSVRLDKRFLEGTKIRPEGGFTFGPWLVKTTPELLMSNTYAEAIHRCHPFWYTRTLFWNSANLSHFKLF